MKSEQTDTLATYGNSFQLKVIASLLTDGSFANQVCDILEPTYFESSSTSWLAEQVSDYVQKYKKPPTLEALGVLISEVSDDVLKLDASKTMKAVSTHMADTDLPFVQEKTLEFCKQQSLKSAILRSVDLLRKGNYEAIRTAIDKAMNAGGDRDLGHQYNEQIADRYTEFVRNPIPTDWDIINQLLDGGLGSGEIGVVIASAGGGKSWALVNIASSALKRGKNVLYYTLELNPFYVGLRFDSVLTGIPFAELKQDENRQRIASVATNLKGRLIVKQYPTKSASVQTLRAHIHKCKMQGFKPDLIIIDYADLMRATSSSSEKRFELESLYEEIRGLAGEHDLPIWTATQSNREGSSADIIEGNKVSEAYSKIMISDFIMSLSRKLEDKVKGTGRWHIVKNRFGPDGMTYPSRIDASNGGIKIFDAMSVDGQKVSSMYSGGEEQVMRSHLKSKLELFKKRPEN